MAIRLSSNSFSTRLFLTVAGLFLVFVACFVGYQYHRERQYKVSILDTRLQDYNNDLGSIGVEDIDDFISIHPIDGLRVTLLDEKGRVLYDNDIPDVSAAPDHSGRKEFQDAMRKGHGYDIKRASATVTGVYFYSATHFPGREMVIRTALPYDLSLGKMLASDTGFIWVALVLTLILLILYYLFTKELGNDSENEKTRLKRQLTQNIAHELKTPVASIQGYLETIENDPGMDEITKKQFIDRSYAQSTRLANLLRDITLLTRLDEASASFEREEICLREVVEGVATESAPALSDRRMTFLNRIPADATCNCNPALIYSIFRNLTDNSIFYAGEGTAIAVKLLSAEDGRLTVSFEDNGHGVPKEHLNRIFERFYRIDKGRSRKLGGTGLGLAIVKNAVLLHGGAVRATLAESGGLRIIFSLPE